MAQRDARRPGAPRSARSVVIARRERLIQAAVDAALRDTVGPTLAGFEAIERAASETSDDGVLGRRVRGILEAVWNAQIDELGSRDDIREAPSAQAQRKAG